MSKKTASKQFSENLARLLDEKGKTQSELATYLGVSNTTVNNYVKGYNAPRMDKIDKISNFFNISRAELIGDQIPIESIPGAIPVRPIKKIPILGRIICGEPLTNYENFDGYMTIDPSVFTADFCLVAEGDSMIEADIHEGDYVFIKKTPQVENGAISAVLIDDKTTLKKFYKTEDEIILQACNSDYQPIVIREEDNKNVAILGEMTGVYSRRNK